MSIQDDTPNRREYTGRINRVIDHIENNLLGDLSLAAVAGVANFSPFHFHRVFRAMTGETLHQFILRLRLERAAWALLTHREMPVTTIALDHGFSSASTFARAFQAQFGMSATRWRASKRKIRKADGKNRQQDRKDGKAPALVKLHLDPGMKHPSWELHMHGLEARVDIVNREEATVAYARAVGDYADDEQIIGDMWGRLMSWAAPRGLLEHSEALCVYHDNPEITAGERLRTSACVTVPPGTEVGRDIGKMTLAGGQYARGRFQIGQGEYGMAWDAMFGGWLPESGFVPDDRPSFEVYGHLKSPGPGKHSVSIFVPVRPI